MNKRKTTKLEMVKSSTKRHYWTSVYILLAELHTQFFWTIVTSTHCIRQRRDILKNMLVYNLIFLFTNCNNKHIKKKRKKN